MFGMSLINIQRVTLLYILLFEIVVEVVPRQFLVVKVWTTFEINIAFQRFHIILLLHMMNTTQLHTNITATNTKGLSCYTKCDCCSSDSLSRDAATTASNINAHVISDISAAQTTRCSQFLSNSLLPAATGSFIEPSM